MQNAISLECPTEPPSPKDLPCHLTRNVSREFLVPEHNSHARKSSRVVAIFNLVATVCGGGVLSLPYAFSIAGVVPAMILMAISAVAAYFALYILCMCARRTGSKSYGEIARYAFGPAAEILTTVLLFALLIMVLTAYMVLAKDIWTPIILYFLGCDNSVTEAAAGKWVLLAVLIVDIPLFTKRDLHALRHTCFVGIGSLITLCAALIWHAWDENVVIEPTMFQTHVLVFTSRFSDVVAAFPLVSNSFMCIFNVLSVHGALVKPTRKRVKSVLNGVIVTCFLLFTVVGACGYFYAYSDTNGNILLNFDVSDKPILLGMIGYAITIMFGMPLVLLPCREALLLIPEQWTQWNDEVLKEVSLAQGKNGRLGEEWPLLANVEQRSLKEHTDFPLVVSKPYTRTDSEVVDDMRALIEEKNTFGKSMAPMAPIIEELSHQPTSVLEYTVQYGSTVAIVGLCYTAALTVPSVALVWSICGSSINMMIGYMIPAACYIKICVRKGMTMRSFLAWLMLISASIACVICTYQAISNI